nr:substrate-binding domain-containing protein [Thermosphaera aggregans]
MNRQLTLITIALVAVVVVGVLISQIIPRNASSSTTTETPATSELRGLILHGAGATFPYPQISEWARRFQEKYGIQVVYQSVGSGAGQSMFLQSLDYVYELVRISLAHYYWNSVDTAEELEEERFTLHYWQAGGRANIPQPQDARSIINHDGSVPPPRVLEGEILAPL